MSEEQDHINIILNTGVSKTSADGQSTDFVGPEQLRKRARELDEEAAEIAGTPPKRPLFRKINIWGHS